MNRLWTFSLSAATDWICSSGLFSLSRMSASSAHYISSGMSRLETGGLDLSEISRTDESAAAI